ncbi:3'(2'),5'-bisphosphate nucleotidase CysQ [Sphingomonas immobilis]|uniref:3'(2'),5'-bisphosphate nucleotidase CysQ n=1 Tax=Sphingomonas immobilis TaxID=3063997 RepID=A0ABT8ZYW6_9SPHN|nr:3'(2'),5'-bisphosphate nucleotidase CysQ [Sphingomonas sp. CA1-15]MDO7842478.1 3'(2'),5'-bisphosphate nucleotidase CysQ [Sphingomonas sp. CA1-15]
MADVALADRIAEIAAEAGALAMGQWRTDFERWEKSPGNPVCAVDLEVDALLRDRLSALDPGAGWLSEETADNADRLALERLWVVDPIDGTRDYIRGRPGWAVSIALIEHGVPVIGVLDAPARGEVWRAARGKGATRNGVRLRAGGRADFPGARVPTDALPKVDHDLVAVDKPNSIALRIAMVAADEADLVATVRWGYEWDIAAAVLIAGEAGATVTDAFGQPLAFNTQNAQAFGVLATVPGIHAAARDRLRARAEAARG